MNNTLSFRLTACLSTFLLLPVLGACTALQTQKPKTVNPAEAKENSDTPAQKQSPKEAPAEVEEKPEAQAQQPSSDVQFICAEGYDQQTDSRLPTTYAWTERGKIAVIRWSTKFFGEKYTPQKRCELVSPRFQKAYNNDTLSYLTNGTLNGKPVICTATQKNGDCANLLLTLRPQDDPLSILKGLSDVLQGRQSGPVRHRSGRPSQVYYQIDMEKFLRTAPVEQEQSQGRG